MRAFWGLSVLETAFQLVLARLYWLKYRMILLPWGCLRAPCKSGIPSNKLTLLEPSILFKQFAQRGPAALVVQGLEGVQINSHHSGIVL